ncbi:MAG: ATP-binding cassette domain-containing protein [Lentisphaerae bacterium]|jgi:macrolide transport system ATP-binding/permease protein|nr:ATP-binding cassette domain-containing protein [Lentisphaerota bacterium]
MKSIIHISGLERHYKMGDHIVAALDGVDLEVNPGDFLMIVGSSGSGKSTLMHLLGLLDIPTGGVMEINSQSMTNCNDAALSFLRNEHIGFVFQQFNLLNDLNVIENIGLPLVYRGVPKNIRQAKAKELASKLGLGNRLRHHPKELSGGQLQRVAIARALIAEPDIILADEPTGNLDSTTSKEIMQILYDLNQQGHTIIMVTHDPKLANTGTRKITLSDGKIIEDCPGQRTPNPNPIIRESNVASKKTLSLVDLLRIGVKEGLLAHQMRTFLTMLGIIIGVSSVIAMSSFSLGSKQKQADQIRALGANLVRIVDKQFETERLVDTRVRGSLGLSRNDLAAIREGIPEIGKAACLREIKLSVLHEHNQINARVLGIEGDYLVVNNLSLQAGRPFDEGDKIQSSPSVILGGSIAKTMLRQAIDTGAQAAKAKPKDLVGTVILLGGSPFRVVGILEDKQIDLDELEATSISDPNNDILIPLETLLTRTSFLDLRSELDEIQLQLKTEDDLARAGRAIKAILGMSHSGVADYDLVIPMDLLKQKQQSQRLLDILTICISSISIVVGGIGIMNIMLASVTERIREIGIRRAVGATRFDIMRQFLSEAMTISVTGGIFGVILAAIVVIITCQLLELPIVFSLTLLLIAVIASTATGLIFGIYPAYQAANKNPVEALRAE